LRPDGRANDDLRPISVTPHYLDHNSASVLVKMGKTWVLCVASVAEEVPRWLRDQAQGWVTAEYGLLPASTHTRTRREAATGRIKGRTHEIQRMIGRSLRTALDLRKLGERTITRRNVWRAPVAAVSVGVVQGDRLLDLCYQEDSQADVDLNVVMDAHGRYVEVQGTAEGRPFEREVMDGLLNLAEKGIKQLLAVQNKVLA